MFLGLTAAKNGDLILSFCTVPDGLPGEEVLPSSERPQWGSPDVIAQSSETNGFVQFCRDDHDGCILQPWSLITLKTLF